MDRIFQDAKDKNVSCNVIYGKSAKAYKDAACTVQLKTSELVEAVSKRALISLNGTTGYAVPIGITYDSKGEVATVNYITPNATTATSADIAGLAAVKD